MPTRDSTPAGAPCWIDLLTSDPDRALQFYGELFGWTAEVGGAEFGGYTTFFKDGSKVAGCMQNDGQSGSPDVWTVYLAVDDAQAAVDLAAANGGEVYLAPMEVADLGSMAMVADAGQAAVGLWQPGSHTSFERFGEPGAPSWFELHTRDYEATVTFYETVFNWDAHVMSDAPDFRYTTLGEGDSAAAGIMDSTAMLPDGAPAHWAVYFGVDDTDAALDKVVELGGSVVMPAEDTPYGRLAVASDPTGTQFRLVEAPAES